MHETNLSRSEPTRTLKPQLIAVGSTLAHHWSLTGLGAFIAIRLPTLTPKTAVTHLMKLPVAISPVMTLMLGPISTIVGKLPFGKEFPSAMADLGAATLG